VDYALSKPSSIYKYLDLNSKGRQEMSKGGRHTCTPF